MFNFIARLFQRGRTIQDLARQIGCRKDELLHVPITYDRFTILKRSGGVRVIHAPAPELKRLQRLLVRRVLAIYSCHRAAMAYERGRSILDNALPHARQNLVLKMDLVDFFPSIPAAKVRGFFRKRGWGTKACELLVQLTMLQDGLPQGAPTSPRLSNLVNGDLDVKLFGMAQYYGFRYTRYADDLTFSSSKASRGDLHAFIRLGKKICEEHGYRVHRRKKLSVHRAHQRQMVTGLVVNDRPRLPHETRRWLRAVRHRFMTGGDITISHDQLMGWIGVQRMLDDL